MKSRLLVEVGMYVTLGASLLWSSFATVEPTSRPTTNPQTLTAVKFASPWEMSTC